MLLIVPETPAKGVVGDVMGDNAAERLVKASRDQPTARNLADRDRKGPVEQTVAAVDRDVFSRRKPHLIVRKTQRAMIEDVDIPSETLQEMNKW